MTPAVYNPIGAALLVRQGPFSYTLTERQALQLLSLYETHGASDHHRRLSDACRAAGFIAGDEPNV